MPNKKKQMIEEVFANKKSIISHFICGAVVERVHSPAVHGFGGNA